MNDSEVLMSLREALRERQDLGLLPCEAEVGRRFQVMVSEIGAPVFRNLVTALCLEGLSVHLLMALDESPSYIGIQIDHPPTYLCLWPGPTIHELTSSLQGGPHPEFRSDRPLCLRGLTPTILEAAAVNQLRLVLCPQEPII